MPAEAAKKISATIDRALNDETFRAALTKAGFPPLKPQSEAATREFVDADKARWLGVLKQMNFTLD
jgi:tripartite-type tricarboxylate transporter receptor subunit TctC